MPSGFWLGGGGGGGGEIKSFFQKPENFAVKYWGGGRSPNFFQTLGLHNGDLNLVLKTFLDQFCRKFLNI